MCLPVRAIFLCSPRAVEEQREGIFEKKAAELERRVDVLHRENRVSNN